MKVLTAMGLQPITYVFLITAKCGQCQMLPLTTPLDILREDLYQAY